MSIQNIQGAKKAFDHEVLRPAIVLGMILQILLMLWPNLRKLCVSHPYIRIIGLVCYLTIDFCSTLTLGMILNVNMDAKANDDDHPRNKYLLALWATVVLRHLGAHSTVTAFSLADNEFWYRHIIRFVYHELMAFLICVLSFSEARLRFPSCVLFVVSTFKFGEGVWALKRGGMDELRRSTIKVSVATGQRITHVIDEAQKKIQANRAGNVQHSIDIPQEENEAGNAEHHPNDMPEDARPARVIQLCADYQSFKKHKHLYIGNFFMNYGQGESGELGERFVGRLDNQIKPWEWVETQLNFAYDLFYTKRVFLHSLWGWFFRVVHLVLICLAWWGFADIDKRDFLKSDVRLTHFVLSVTLFLDVVSFLESVTSNQTLVQVGFRAGDKWRHVENIILWLLRIENTVLGRIFQRQSISMGQFNLLSYSVNDYRSWKWTKQLLNFFELKAYWDNYWYTLCISLDHTDYFNLMNRTILNLVRSRITTRNLAEGEKWFSDFVSPELSALVGRNFQEYIRSDFEQCVIIWHVATAICYKTSTERPSHLQHAKYISENILYLLKVHPSMLSSLITSEQKSYNSACSETSHLLAMDGNIMDVLENNVLENNESPQFGIISQMGSDVRDLLVLEAFKLAREMSKLRLEDGWPLMLRVWIDILSYAAYHSQGKDHAELLGSGGELLTHVWLYIHHLIGSYNQTEGSNSGSETINQTEGEDAGSQIANQTEGEDAGSETINQTEGEDAGSETINQTEGENA